MSRGFTNEDNRSLLVFFRFVLFFLLGAITVNSRDLYDTARQGKIACELNLPRNQICVMYFKPEETGEQHQ